MSELMRGHPVDALKDLREAANEAKRDDGGAPARLTSRIDMAAAEAAKQSR